MEHPSIDRKVSRLEVLKASMADGEFLQKYPSIQPQIELNKLINKRTTKQQSYIVMWKGSLNEINSTTADRKNVNSPVFSL